MQKYLTAGMKYWQIAGVLLLVSLTEGGRPCQVSDGCSILLGLKIWYSKAFSGACDHHDVCFYCHALYNASQKYCDELFLDVMLDTCLHVDDAPLIQCDVGAVWYYFFMRLFGGPFYHEYDNHIKAFCHEPRIKGCIGK